MMMQTQSSILDPIRDELSSYVWNDPKSERPELKPVHAHFLHKHLYSVLEKAGYGEPHKWLTLCLTGSICTYQYSDTSDVDVSLFIDSDVLPEWSRAEMIGLMIENETKLPGTPFECQFFVVGRKLKPSDLYKSGLRSGYDVDKHHWIVPPDSSMSHDVEIQENAAYVQALEHADRMERLLRYEPDKAVMLWHQIHKRRMRDQSAGKGDYSDANILYKFLAHRNLLPQIAEVSGEHIASLKDLVHESIDYGEAYVNDQEKRVQIILGDADDNELYDKIRAEAERKYPEYTLDIDAEANGPWTDGDATRGLLPGWKKIAQKGKGEWVRRYDDLLSGSMDPDSFGYVVDWPDDEYAKVVWGTDGEIGDAVYEPVANLIQSDPPPWLKQGAIDNQAVLDANAGQDLQGLPGVINSGIGPLQFHSHGDIQRIANEYNQANGLGPHPDDYLRVNPERAQQVAQAYEQMPHNPGDPQIAQSYQALAHETRAQYDAAVRNGYRFEFYPQDHDPYPHSPREAVLDLHHNKHMYVYPTAAGFGTDDAAPQDHPMLGDSGVRWDNQLVTHNDLFRAVHDFYGHAKEGVGFRADGEDNAYRQHSAMFSSTALPAMAAETRGQNSWVNHGPYGQQNQNASTADTVFAPQRAGLLPGWATDPDLHRDATVAAWHLPGFSNIL
jgi:hypothetical protein